jgi:hypothetical protein
MVWFKVDDKAHSNTKVRKVLATAPAALSLWTVAGSWSSDNLTDGLIPDDQLPWLMPAGADELARALVAAGLWRRVRGGYQFHQWEKDGDGTRRNPTRAEVETERAKKAEAGRRGGLASGKTRSKAEAPASAPAEAGAHPVVEPPTRPDPTGIGVLLVPQPTVARATPEPPTRCERHRDTPAAGSCGPCADARRARGAWEADKRARLAAAPQCAVHRGEPAHNCGRCRADLLAADAA